MSRWLQRFTIFAVIAGLIIGGLGWATAAALRMEENHRRVEAQKERADKMRHAMLRLDSVIAPPLARENSRPFDQFTPLNSPFPAMTQQGMACAPGSIRVPSLLMKTELPPWMLLHFQFTPGIGNRDDHGWQSPQVIKKPLRDVLQREPFGLSLANVTPEREELLTQFRTKYSSELLLTEVRRRAGPADTPGEPAFNDSNLPNPPAPGNQSKDNPGDWARNGNALQNQAPQGAQQPAQQYAGDPDKMARRDVSNVGKFTPRGGRSVDPDVNLDSITTKAPSIGEVHLTSMTAMWFPSAERPDYLVYARLAHFGPKEIVQGVIIDWPKLREELEAPLADLFPDSHLVPLGDDADHDADNVMSALPAQLDAGVPPALSPAGWTPLRVGLGVAWSAVLLALTAMGLSAYSLIDLSERRIRFVSAVTHELRTPLTTLRLYLDMLTSGLVRDPSQKEEYLHTLNTESERLHRLISNVLDFARLEKQSARSAPADIAPADLLEQVKAAWQSRCDAAG